MSRKLTLEEFIEKARAVHGDKYDYSKSNVDGNKNKVVIICSEHGEFLQSPNSHMRGRGCRKCAGNNYLKDKCSFIKEANKVHDNKYDYSKVEYKNNRTKVNIICPEHGEFLQSPKCHIHRKQGCPKCSGKVKSHGDFIIKANNKHGDKFNYNKVEYINSVTDIKIECPIHGWFDITPVSHIRNKHGCPKCGMKIKIETTEQFIERSNITHDYEYNYEMTVLINMRNPVKIKCMEHGIFEQLPHNHIRGAGCPKCLFKQETKTGGYLNEILGFTPKKKYINIDGIRHIVDFGFTMGGSMVLVEYNGEQHYDPHFFISRMGEIKGKEKFDNQIIRDKRLRGYCIENNIPLLEIDGRKYKNDKIKEILIEFINSIHS